jgi:hypothetical protein
VSKKRGNPPKEDPQMYLHIFYNTTYFSKEEKKRKWRSSDVWRMNARISTGQLGKWVE